MSAKHETELVRAYHLKPGDRLVSHKSATGQTTYPTISDLSVDGGFIHVRFAEDSPMTFFRGDQVLRLQRQPDQQEDHDGTAT